MEWISTIQHAINYIEEHLLEEINYEDVDGLIAFIEECNINSVSYICNKYGLTQKQLSNRKYLITKSLKDRNIPFTMIKKSRKDV